MACEKQGSGMEPMAMRACHALRLSSPQCPAGTLFEQRSLPPQTLPENLEVHRPDFTMDRRGEAGRQTGGVPHGHGNAHHTDGGQRLVSGRDAAAHDQSVVKADGRQTAQRDLVGVVRPKTAELQASPAGSCLLYTSPSPRDV
jgi:hypothetical protein